jgi:hypothetical protein
MRIRDPGWKKFGSGIWDKHAGLMISRVPDDTVVSLTGTCF